MNLNEYQTQAMRTSGSGHSHMQNGCLGLIGETGEIVDIIKKYKFQSGENPPFPKEKMIDEMGDVLWYCAETATGMVLKLEDIVLHEGDYDRFSVLAYLSGESIETTAIMLSIMATDAYIAFFIDRDFDRGIFRVRDIYNGLKHICKLIDTTIEHIAEMNISKLKKRYPDGFDPERSIHRPEYERNEQADATHLFNAKNKVI